IVPVRIPGGYQVPDHDRSVERDSLHGADQQLIESFAPSTHPGFSGIQGDQVLLVDRDDRVEPQELQRCSETIPPDDFEGRALAPHRKGRTSLYTERNA